MAAYQWRALVGPRYNHYAWPNLSSGSTAVLDYNTVLLGGMTSGTTTVTVGSTASFPSSGGVWIGPDTVLSSGVYQPLAGSVAAFEYIQYTGKNSTQLTGCVREVAGNSHNLTHAAGVEQVYWWYPLHHDDGSLRFSRTFNGTLSAITMEGQLKGYLARHWLLRNNHLIAIQTRTSATGTWQLELLGVIDNPNWRDDSGRQSQWSVNIKSMEWPWANQKIRGVKIGKLNVATGSTGTADTALVLASDERDSGDYTMAAPDFEAEKAVEQLERLSTHPRD